MMTVVKLELAHHQYEIRIEPGALRDAGKWMRQVAPHQRAALFCDQNILDTHGGVAQRAIQQEDYQLLTVGVPARESAKNLESVQNIYGALLDAHLERQSPVVALGGGVVGDTVGFAAATYLRGVPFIQCPTTLLAMVDASVGGKVGVNMPKGKNLIGSFYQPRMVIVDTDTLSTLPRRELQCGLAECVKHALIRDADLFDWIENHLDAIFALDTGVMVELVRRNVHIKAQVVMADEKESAQRAHLNLGHTFAHAIETTQNPHAPVIAYHGEAVALGLVAATHLAMEVGQCSAHVLDRLLHLLEHIGLATTSNRLAPTEVLMEVMLQDKKVLDDKLRLVLPTTLGAATIVEDVPQDTIASAWGAIRN